MANPKARALLLALALLLLPLAGWSQDTPAEIEVGKPLPAVTGTDLLENRLELTPLLGRRPVVLSFWSIYCGDCVRELDDLRVMRAEVAQEEIDIIAVNTDSSIPVARIASFLKRYEGARGSALNVRHLLDRDGSIVDTLGINYIPLMVTLDKSGVVTSVMSGYDPAEDKQKMQQAFEQGSVTLGAWSSAMRAKLRSVLRSQGPTGAQVESATYRVEESMLLFGWHDSLGFVKDAAGRTDPEPEKRRVEKVVADRLKILLMRSALETVGLTLPDNGNRGFDRGGINIPESPFEGDFKFKRLYQALAFDEMFQVEQKAGLWSGTEYQGGMVASVDLGRLKAKVEQLEIPLKPESIRIIAVSDFDFKPRATLTELRKYSYRVLSFVDQSLLYHGTAEELAAELGALKIPGLTIFAESAEDGKSVRIEAY